MALADLTKKIADDASLAIARIQRDSAEAVAHIAAQGKKTEQELRRKFEEDTSSRLAQETTRSREITEREKRMVMEVERRKLIDELFRDAEHVLSSMSDDAFATVVLPFLKTLPHENVLTLHTPPGRVPVLTRILHDANLPHSVLADDSVADGFVAKGSNMELHATFDDLVREVRHRDESAVARIFFA